MGATASVQRLARRHNNGDLATTNLAFGGQDNKEIFVMEANSGTFWRFKTPYSGLIGPGGTRLPEQK